MHLGRRLRQAYVDERRSGHGWENSAGRQLRKDVAERGFRPIRRSSGRKKRRSLAKTLDILTRPGVYVLYRDGVPYYIGKAARMRSRLWQHAWNRGAATTISGISFPSSL